MRCDSSVAPPLRPLRHVLVQDGGGLRGPAGDHHGPGDGGVCQHRALPDVRQVSTDESCTSRRLSQLTRRCAAGTWACRCAPRCATSAASCVRSCSSGWPRSGWSCRSSSSVGAKKKNQSALPSDDSLNATNS